jgi:uncharacterized protein
VALGLGRPEDAGPPYGANDLDREAIVAFTVHNFARFFGGAENDFRTVVAEGEAVVVEHLRLFFVFRVRDGKIWQIREYMDTRGGWAQVFGDGEPGQLIEFVAG